MERLGSKFYKESYLKRQFTNFFATSMESSSQLLIESRNG